MLTLLRNLLAALLAAAFLLGTALGDPNKGGDGTGGWIQLPNGNNHSNGSFRVVYRLKRLDDGFTLRLARSMNGAVCLVSFGEGASVLISSQDGMLHFPGPQLRAIKDAGVLDMDLTIVAPNEDVLVGKIVFDDGEGLTVKIE